jgi:hypothetical protein
MEELETFKNQMLAAIKEAKEKKSSDSQKEKSDFEEKEKDKNAKYDEIKEKINNLNNKEFFPSLAEIEKEEKASLSQEIENIKSKSKLNPYEEKKLTEKQAELEQLLKGIKEKERQDNSPSEK